MSDDREADVTDSRKLSGDTLPVGLDHFRLFIEQIASGPRLARARREHAADLARSSRQEADALMTLDLIGGLAGAGSWEEVTRKILDLFESLFAPRALLLAPVAAGNLAEHVSRPVGLPADRTALGAFLESDADHAVAADGAGFTLRLAHAGETLGVLVAEGLRFPEHLQRYLPSALVVARVCGLALFNARTYGLLAGTVRDLQGALERVRVLRGMIPICSYCKNIRNDEGFWQTVEGYVRDHTDATFSHGMCPSCIEKHWKPQLEQLRDATGT